MLKRYTFWLWTAVVFQLLTGVFHAISLFVSPQPANETERQLLTLTTTYHIDAGGGFHPTFSGLFTALSSCFTFLCLFAALINLYLLRMRTDPSAMKGIIGINLLVFAPLFVVMAYFTFLPPIICTGLIVLSLLAAYLAVGKAGDAR